MNPDFNFFVTGIEDGMMAVLNAASPDTPSATPYRGELDVEELGRESKAALRELVSRLPLYLVSYVDGYNRSDVDDLWQPGEARTFEHNCTFAVVCCASDWRGSEQAEGVSRMISVALTSLSGRMFKQEVARDGETEIVDLNLTPLAPSPENPNPAFIVRLDELTVYAVYFDTFFKYTVTPPPLDETIIDTINFNIELRNRRSANEGMPGVQIDD